MKRTLFLLILICSLASNSFAQKARISQKKLDKVEQPCVQIEFKYEKEVVKEILTKRLKSDNIKFDKKLSRIECFGVRYFKLSENDVNIYFLIEEKDGVSTISLFISKGVDNFRGPRTEEAANAIAYLESFDQDFAEWDYQQAILQQEKVVADAIKLQTKLIREKEKLAQDKIELEQAIETNKVNLQNADSDLEQQKIKLEEKKNNRPQIVTKN